MWLYLSEYNLEHTLLQLYCYTCTLNLFVYRPLFTFDYIVISIFTMWLPRFPFEVWFCFDLSSSLCITIHIIGYIFFFLCVEYNNQHQSSFAWPIRADMCQALVWYSKGIVTICKTSKNYSNTFLRSRNTSINILLSYI